MSVRKIATCMCGEQAQIPPDEQWKQKRKQSCDDPECSFLNKCDNCNWKSFLSRYCRCSCSNCKIVRLSEIEVHDDKNEPDFGLTGVSRIPKGKRWNPALGEYCETTGDVEKYRKQQGKAYVPDSEPPAPYEPSDSEKSREKRLNALGVKE